MKILNLGCILVFLSIMDLNAQVINQNQQEKENEIQKNYKVEIVLPDDIYEFIKSQQDKTSEQQYHNVEINLSNDFTEKIDIFLGKLENQNGSVLIAIVALIGTLIASIISSYNNRKNLEKQIKANKDLEYEKNAIEKSYKKNVELKEMVANFILNSSLLNYKFYEIIHYVDIGQKHTAEDKYKETHKLRQLIIGYYYSIKVALDGSDKQQNLEKIIDKYLNLIEFKFNVSTLNSLDYEQLIGELYHKIKAIIHDNYTEPI